MQISFWLLSYGFIVASSCGLDAASSCGYIAAKARSCAYIYAYIYLNRDLWKPALMTFMTFYVKIVWKTPKIKKFDMFKYCL